VTEHGLAVMSVWPHEGRPNIKDGWPRDEHGALLPLDEQAEVEDVTEHVARWWSPWEEQEIRPGEKILRCVTKFRYPGVIDPAEAISRMVLIWEPCPFEDVRRGRVWRWVVDLALAETMRVAWKPDVWQTTLYHAMGHSILHLCANFYGEDRTHKLVADLGYNRENVRAS
jgi:hypothetical protein